MLDRRRLLRGSLDRQTVQAHPMAGTPVEVPVPKKVIFIRTPGYPKLFTTETRRRKNNEIVEICDK